MADQVFVFLKNWPLNQATIEALKDLPEWPAALGMITCMWSPAETDAGSALARCVPAAYSVWALPENTPVAVRDAVCAGINAKRGAEEGGRKWVGRVHVIAELEKQRRHVGEHVTLHCTDSAE